MVLSLPAEKQKFFAVFGVGMANALKLDRSRQTPLQHKIHCSTHGFLILRPSALGRRNTLKMSMFHRERYNMRKIITSTMALLVGASMLVGCAREEKAKVVEKVSGPGGTTTTTTEKTVESTGKNPPANSSGEAVPPK